MCTTNEVPEQEREPAGGGHGGKATDRGEHRADDHIPDSELERCVARPARCAGSSKERQAVKVHGATSPCVCPTSGKQLLRFRVGGSPRSRRNDMEGVRDGSECPTDRVAQSCASRNVSSATFQESLHPQGRWTTAPLRDCCAGRQDCPARSGDSPQSDLRIGLSGILLWVPTWATTA